MNHFSEKLHVPWGGGRIHAPNRSGLYWDIFSRWWDIFSLHGNGLLCGDEYPEVIDLKAWFSDRYPAIDNIFATSLENSDINWDICYPMKTDIRFDWIVCQAVLEHVKDPVAAMKNLASVVADNGLIYLHSHGPKFKEHRHPIDCYRFMRDGVLALTETAGLELVDILYTQAHWFTLSRKARNGS